MQASCFPKHRALWSSRTVLTRRAQVTQNVAQQPAEPKFRKLKCVPACAQPAGAGFRAARKRR